MELETLNLECEFITPAFLGNASQQAELRTAPFKGMFRWWYRQIYPGKNDDEIFGSVEYGASKIKMVVFDDNEKCRIKNENPNEAGKKINVTTTNNGKMPPKTFLINILDYLAYGKCNYDKTQRRIVYENSHITPSSKFNLKIQYPKEYEEEILQTMSAFFKYGCIGSKNRNGFGSVSVKENNRLPKNIHIPNSKLFVTEAQYAKWEDALSEIGIIYKNARCSLDKKHVYTNRLLLAKPIVQARDNNRLPKSLCLSVKKNEQGKFYGQILSLSNKDVYIKIHAELKKYM
ncbi:MAG: RAMP superfamily CRISPR-associated protein [Fibromonadales bacterium]|nr:RAMP superfamily CRISPR-associated protein [Fibromonadales bacterium]